jgi:hypothetical protein
MPFSNLTSFALLTGAFLFVNTQSAHAGSLFTFESNAPNTATPFTDNVSGLSAAFGGKASVCDSQGIFQSLSGNVLVQGLCGPSTESGPLSASFPGNLTSINLDFGTAGTTGTLTLTAFENDTEVGSANFTSILPSGQANGEGSASFSGSFNRVMLSSDSLLAIDNINAQTTAPEPSTIATVFAGAALLAGYTRRRKRR